MKNILAQVITAAVVASCSSDMISLSDIRVRGTSQQSTSEFIYFTTSDDIECAGIRVGGTDTDLQIAFMHEGVQVDTKAVFPNDYSWEGFLRVEVPISQMILNNGGSMSLTYVDSRSSQEGPTFTYPPMRQSNTPFQADRPSAGR